MRVVAFDPGGTTGWAVVERETRVWEAGRIVGPWITHPWQMLEKVAEHAPDAVVLEDFNLRAGLNRGAASRRVTLEPVRINAALEWAWHQAQEEAAELGEDLGMDLPALVFQQPDERLIVTDDRLKRWGMWHTNRHARDALRHAVVFLRKTKSKEACHGDQ